jgi:hypothetical protein
MKISKSFIIHIKASILTAVITVFAYWIAWNTKMHGLIEIPIGIVFGSMYDSIAHKYYNNKQNWIKKRSNKDVK